MKLKKRYVFILITILIAILSSCSTGTVPTVAQSTGQTAEGTASGSISSSVTQPAPSSSEVEYDPEDLTLDASIYTMSYLSLDGESITTSGSGVEVSGNSATIISPGAYTISGTLSDGQINVDTQEDGTVVLLLDGVNITSSTSAPIYVRNAEKVIINLVDGTQNIVTDGNSYILEDVTSDEPNAAIFSKDDLVINGNGSLTVNAHYNNGIASKDTLKITAGALTVNAVNDGIKGRDCITVRNATITVSAGSDGLQSNNDKDTSLGYVIIESGTINITSGADGIQAETRLAIYGGEFHIVTAGGSIEGTKSTTQGFGDWNTDNNSSTGTSSESAKALKAGEDVTIHSGTFQIDSMEDGIHSNNSITINGGDIQIAAGDDALHADSALTINNGNLVITKSYEGLESKSMTINGGYIHMFASDDGINGSSGASTNVGQGPNGFGGSNDASLAINGGYIYVDANGDGVDINGPMTMSAGILIVNGPTNNGNGPLDYTGTFKLTGGYLLAVGSSGMAMAPDNTSTQYSVLYGFNTAQAANTIVHIQTADGQDILTFVPAKNYQSVVFSSAQLATGVYSIHVDGTSTGTVTDGLYSNGTYSSGTKVAEFTISSIVTSAGAISGGMFPGGGNPGGGGGRPHP